jgi:hypothetical protein
MNASVCRHARRTARKHAHAPAPPTPPRASCGDTSGTCAAASRLSLTSGLRRNCQGRRQPRGRRTGASRHARAKPASQRAPTAANATEGSRQSGEERSRIQQPWPGAPLPRHCKAPLLKRCGSRPQRRERARGCCAARRVSAAVCARDAPALEALLAFRAPLRRAVRRADSLARRVTQALPSPVCPRGRSAARESDMEAPPDPPPAEAEPPPPPPPPPPGTDDAAAAAPEGGRKRKSRWAPADEVRGPHCRRPRRSLRRALLRACVSAARARTHRRVARATQPLSRSSRVFAAPAARPGVRQQRSPRRLLGFGNGASSDALPRGPAGR